MTGSAGCPAVTAEQMREVDRAMVEDFRIDLARMMENAGRSVAELAVDLFGARRVVVLAGPGGNGGGGLVAARHVVPRDPGYVTRLRRPRGPWRRCRKAQIRSSMRTSLRLARNHVDHRIRATNQNHGALANRGREVHVVLAAPAGRLGAVPAHQVDILTRMEVAVATAPPPAGGLSFVAGLGEVDLIVDALIGYGLAADPTEPTAGLIRWANAHPAPVLSLDTPSGLDVTTGVAARPCVLATATLTLALPKTGLLGAPQAGRLYLADISVPPLLLRRMGIEVGDLFGTATIVALNCGDRAEAS